MSRSLCPFCGCEMERTFAVIWDAQNNSADARAQAIMVRLRVKAPLLALTFSAPGVSVFHSGKAVRPLPDERGVLIGHVYAKPSTGAFAMAGLLERSTNAPAFGSAPQEVAAKLAVECWGDYLAFVHDARAQTLCVARDPSGARDCYVGSCADVTVVFTHADDVRASHALPLVVDDGAVLLFLMRQHLQTRRTGLLGVEEIQPGECVTLSPREKHWSTLWAPQLFCGSDEPMDFAQRAEVLEQTVVECAQAWASTSTSGAILHRLSGGLNSALALEALTRTRTAAVTAVHYFVEDMAGADERVYARQAAAAAGVELIEVAMNASAIDYRRARGPLHARPSAALLSYADERPAEIAARTGADLTTSGAGGDNVFYRIRSALIAADAVRAGGLNAAARAAFMNAARATRRSVWDVTRDALVYGALRRPAPLDEMFPAHTRLIDPEARASVTPDDLRHAWVKSSDDLPPGKLVHIWMLADALNYRWPSILTRASAYRPIPLSQPIIELCLQTPSFVLTQGGRDRALVRAAFEGRLPPAIARRESKGVTTQYFADVLVHNRFFLRERLLDGSLVCKHLLSAPALEAALTDAALARGDAAAHLLTCLAAQLWFDDVASAR